MVQHDVICVFKKFMLMHVVLCQLSVFCYEYSCYVHICVTVHISNLYSMHKHIYVILSED